jgi:amino acid adenylation domain-containing protein
MIPSYYMRLKKLPLTTNGKVDRNTLPVYEFTTNNDYEAPTTETEKKLVAIWAEVLKLDREVIGVNNNFFDLGGQSLKLVFLANRIKETFKISLSLLQLTTVKNIKELAKEITAGTQTDYLTITAAGEKEFYPLSYSQEQFYFLNQLNKNSTVYNQPQVFMVAGPLDIEKMEKVFNGIIRHHEIYRTCFKVINDVPVQYILKDIQFEIETFKASLADSREIITQFFKPFHLDKAPLLRAGLIQVDDERHILLIDRHHIVSDGFSLSIFMRDFIVLYEDRQLSPSRLQYKDYAVWLQSEAYQKSLQSQKQYWKQVFSSPPTALELQTDYDRPSVITYQGGTVDFDIESTQKQLLDRLAKHLGITLSSLVLSILNLLLYKLTGQRDIIIGIPVSGRRSTEIESVMGLFINMLAIRSDVTPNKPLHDFLKQVNQSVILSLENQDYPYQKVVSDIGITREINRNPLFDVMFVYTDEEPVNFTCKDLMFEAMPIESDTSQVDLVMHVNATRSKMQMNFQYSGDLFKHETIESFVQYFKQVTDQVILNTPIKNINLLTAAESALVKQFNMPAISFDCNTSIIEMFDKQVQAFPDREAVVCNGVRISYKQLNEYSNQVAAYLISKGVGKGDVTALIVSRSVDIIVGILGILKSGAAYLPIDYKLPFERISYMLKASNAKVLLGHKEHLSIFETIITTQDIEAGLIKQQAKTNPAVRREASDITYCIFTSGSTGTPKGVLMKDSSIVNLVEGLHAIVYTNLNGSLRIGLVASYSFDASCQQIFPALLKGHSLYICNDEERMDGEKLYGFYKANRINASDGTPTHFGMFIRGLRHGVELPDFKVWLLAGEILSKELVQQFYKYPSANNLVLYNLYGPTETCVDSTYYRIDPTDFNEYKTIPIGRPLPNERVYIVDEFGNSVPQGIHGELCIAGAGLARGYIGNDANNNRFAEDWIPGEKRVYRTGDIAYWLPDGNIAYKGRIDTQIKLRGYRIEPGEIEYRLSGHPAVLETAVVLKRIEGQDYLVAYYIADELLEDTECRNYLAQQVPDYMIPSFFERLEQMPMTANGKLNAAALPIPVRGSGGLYTAASSETEKTLVAIWAEVLQMDVSSISIDESFLQLGGNSIIAIQIANKIKKAFVLEIKLIDLFQKVTIIQQANFIDTCLWINSEDLLSKTGGTEISI